MEDAESLADVAAAPGIETTQFQDFGLVAAPVLEAKGIPEPDHRHPKDPVGERWKDDDLPDRFPKLWAKFGDADA